MVNYGRSAGCKTCKIRKVKCDESRPSCRKCQSIGKSCPGYPDEWDLAYRSENEVVQLRLSNRGKPWQGVISICSRDQPSPGPGNHLTTNIELQVVPMFFQDFVVTSRNDSPYGWLEFLPSLFEKVSEDSALYQAVYAAAYANVAQKYDSLELQYEAIGYYSKALGLVNASLAQPTLASRHVTMTAVVLLGVYECIIGSLSTFAKDLSLCHIHGLGALASLRCVLFTTGLDISLLEIACCQMQRRNLDLGLTPGAEDERLMQLLGTSSIASRMVVGMYEVSKLLASTKSDNARGSTNPKSYSAFLRDAWNIDAHLRCWDDDAMRTLPYEESSPPSKHRDLFPCQKVEYHAYSNIWSAGKWNKHRAARIILHQKILETLDKTHPTDLDDQPRLSEQTALSLSIIYKMVHDVFASVAYSLGATAGSNSSFPKGVGGYFLIWSLKVILRCPFISGEQYFTAKDVLWRVGKECGIGHAVIFSQSLKTTSGILIAYPNANTSQCHQF